MLDDEHKIIDLDLRPKAAHPRERFGEELLDCDRVDRLIGCVVMDDRPLRRFDQRVAQAVEKSAGQRRDIGWVHARTIRSFDAWTISKFARDQ